MIKKRERWVDMKQLKKEIRKIKLKDNRARIKIVILPIVCRYLEIISTAKQQQMIVKDCFTGNKLVMKEKYFWIIKYCYYDLIAH